MLFGYLFCFVFGTLCLEMSVLNQSIQTVFCLRFSQPFETAGQGLKLSLLHFYFQASQIQICFLSLSCYCMLMVLSSVYKLPEVNPSYYGSPSERYIVISIIRSIKITRAFCQANFSPLKCLSFAFRSYFISYISCSFCSRRSRSW